MPRRVDSPTCSHTVQIRNALIARPAKPHRPSRDFSSGCLVGHDQLGDLLRLVDLHVVASAVQQVQLAVREQRARILWPPAG